MTISIKGRSENFSVEVDVAVQSNKPSVDTKDVEWITKILASRFMKNVDDLVTLGIGLCDLRADWDQPQEAMGGE